ncbi:MAG TPA: response regulator [Verrucomicrobiae bacterium]|nr:response regulator [Verrucomicrobiae bacterium]
MSQANAFGEADTILLAEDNEDHIHFIKRSFMHARFLNPIQVTRDGFETIAYLNGDGKFSDRAQYPFPALLLLDLKMLNKDGFEVMEWIRGQNTLPKLQIIALTNSDRIFDVKRAYALGAAGFLTKPMNLHEFIQLGPAIRGFWLWNSREVAMEQPVPQRAQNCPPAAALPVLPLAEMVGPSPAPRCAPTQHVAA